MNTEVQSVWKTLAEFDLNNIAHEWAFISIVCFLFAVMMTICWVLKYKESAEKSNEIDELRLTIEELNKIIDDKTARETEILENFGMKLSTLEKENDKYKDADEYSKIFIDKTVVPIIVKETVDMTEGAYAYFVDEEKKREFALHSSKKAVLKEIVDILASKEYIQWKNVYDTEKTIHTVTGKMLILVDRED